MAEPFSIATWNVNSLRVRLEALKAWLQAHQPTVVCLQETKLEDELFPTDELAALGYHCAFMGQKTYNGVAILSREPMTDVRKGFDGTDTEEQKRLIAAEVAGVRIVNAYIPNGGEVGNERFDHKLRFLEQLVDYFELWERPAQPVVFVGDFNVAPDPIDVYDPAEMEGQVCFHHEERLRLAVVQRWGLLDQFRRLNDQPGQYSFWDFRTNAYKRGTGLRIDHIWASIPMTGRLTACHIDEAERGKDKASDHAPVLATYEGPLD